MIIKIIVYTTLIYGCLFSQTYKTDWVVKVIQSPDSYFSDAYEKHIFKKFLKKFKEINVMKVSDYNNQEQVLLELYGNNDPYDIIFRTDSDNKIKKVFRHLNSNTEMTGSVTEKLIMDWIGKFLYHLDAGDEEAMYNLVYHSETKLKYGKLIDKKKIINSLLKDFPTVIKPDEINIDANNANYTVEVYIHLQHELVLKINSRLANITDTDELQETLYEKISLEMKKNNKPFFQKIKMDTFLTEIESSYHDVKFLDDTLIINYPSFGMETINEMKYAVIDSEDYVSQIESVIKLRPDFKNAVLELNNSYNLSTYVDPLITSPNIKDAENALRTMFNHFITIPFLQIPNIKADFSGTINYRGYNRHNIEIKNIYEWSLFWHEIVSEGAIYFLPSSMELNRNNISITGLIYVLKDLQMNFYHFAELVVNFEKSENLDTARFDLFFYPFLSRAVVHNFKK